MLLLFLVRIVTLSTIVRVPCGGLVRSLQNLKAFSRMHCSKKIERELFHISSCSARNQDGLGMSEFPGSHCDRNRNNIEYFREGGEIPNLRRSCFRLKRENIEIRSRAGATNSRHTRRHIFLESSNPKRPSIQTISYNPLLGK